MCAIAGGRWFSPTAPAAFYSINEKAFDGTRLKASDGYAGSALVLFSEKGCNKCKATKKALKTAQVSLDATQLKLAWVECSKYPSLCERFGVSGDEEGPTGTPYVMWFRDGVEVKDGYDLPTDASGSEIVTWANTKKGAGELK